MSYRYSSKPYTAHTGIVIVLNIANEFRFATCIAFNHSACLLDTRAFDLVNC